MPGFSFSPTIHDHDVIMLLRSGQRLSGRVVEVSPAEIAVKMSDGDGRVVRVNRDDVTAYTGKDDKLRNPVAPRLRVIRCYNTFMKCNGVKCMTTDDVNLSGRCQLYNDKCEKYEGDFFTMSRSAQVKLLSGLQVGEYPSKTKEAENDRRSTGRPVRAPR